MNLVDFAAKRARRLFSRRAAYRALFLSETGEPTRNGDVVLNDLARYCYAYKSTAISGVQTMDPIASAIAQGRREVWLRIQAQLRLPDEAVLQAMENERE